MPAKIYIYLSKFYGDDLMRTKMLVKKPEQASGITNNPVNNNHINKPAAKKKT